MPSPSTVRAISDFDPDPDDAELSGVGRGDLYTGTLISGDVGLSFRTTLGPEDARCVLETVVPFDPSAVPQPIDGLG